MELAVTAFAPTCLGVNNTLRRRVDKALQERAVKQGSGGGKGEEAEKRMIEWQGQ
jgi:hypothetical protein